VCGGLLVEIIGIEFGYTEYPGGDADFVIDHEAGEAGAVDQNNAFDGEGKLAGLGGEGAGRYEDAFGSPIAAECAKEGLNFGTADGSLPAFGLDIYLFEAEFVEGDDAVDIAITGAADALEIGALRAIAYEVEELEHDGFEVGRGDRGKGISDFDSDRGTDFLDGLAEAVLGTRVLIRGYRWLRFVAEANLWDGIEEGSDLLGGVRS
jgi:hypothetical protein